MLFPALSGSSKMRGLVRDGAPLVQTRMDDLELARWIAHLLRQGEKVAEVHELVVIEDNRNG
jgi:hypothetical protein